MKPFIIFAHTDMSGEVRRVHCSHSVLLSSGFSGNESNLFQSISSTSMRVLFSCM